MNELSTPEFIVTKAHRLFGEFCDACRRYRYIGLCYGRPGVGKTMSARYSANWNQIEYLLEHYRLIELPAVPEIMPCATLVYTPPVTASPSRLEKEIYDGIDKLEALHYYLQAALDEQVVLTYPARKSGSTDLLIIDEADRLKAVGLEIVRDIYDRRQIGVILIGMPGIEKRLSRYPQLYSRVGFVHQFKPLSPTEIQFILQHKWRTLSSQFDPEDFTDHEALSTILRITGGNFRLLQRLSSQIERILEINQLRTITKEVVETARESLVIGLS